MSFSRKLVSGVGLLAALLTSNMTAQDAQEGKAVVRAVRGTAQVTPDGDPQNYQALKVGSKLFGGSVIQTGPESSVDLFLGKNGPVIRVTSSTTLALDKLTFVDTTADTEIDTQLNLKAGRILGNVRKMSGNSKYEIKTPAGIAGIRGTEYDMSADGTLTVISGTVVYAFIDPTSGTIQTVVVRTGQTFRPGGQVKSVPADVLQRIKDNIPKEDDKGDPVERDAEVVTPKPEEDEPYVSPTDGQ